MPVIPAFRNLRQEDLKFQASLSKTLSQKLKTKQCKN